MIDITTEQLIPLRDVPKLLPPTARGKRVHVSAVYRWVQRGLGGVKLEAVKLGGRTCTSVEALQRWSDRRTADQAAAPPLTMTAKARQERIERAAREVETILGTGRSRQRRCGGGDDQRARN